MADAKRRLRALVGDLARPYPSAAACLAEDLPALCVHLRYPLRRRKRLRSSNLLERSLEEVRRRTKVIGRFPGETSCLSLCWAVLDLVIAGSHGLDLSDLDRQALLRLTVTRGPTANEGTQRKIGQHAPTAELRPHFSSTRWTLPFGGGPVGITA